VTLMKGLGGATPASLEGLKAAQQKYAHAQMRLAAQRGTVVTLMSKAVAAARENQEQVPTTTAKQ